jgi:glyoxylase I family protein
VLGRGSSRRGLSARPCDLAPSSCLACLIMWPVICRDVEATIWFYHDFLGFPLVELVENRDNPGSSHVFFDLGNRNLLGFFDLPGHEHPPFSETIRGVQHIAISVGPSSSRRREAFDEYLRSDRASTTACTSAIPTGSASSCTARSWGCSTASPCSAESAWSPRPSSERARPGANLTAGQLAEFGQCKKF